MSGAIWTDDRRRRQASLTALRPILGELYEAAIDLLGNPSAPARIPLLAHCMRELGNRLPDALGAELPERATQDEAVKALANRWFEEGLSVSPLDPDDHSIRPSVRLSPLALNAVIDVVVQHELGSIANYARGAYLVQGALPPDLTSAISAFMNGRSDSSRLRDHVGDPVVRAIVETRGFFQGLAHVARQEHRPPSGGALLDQVRYLETAIDGRVGDWWELRADLEDLMALANEDADPRGDEEPGQAEDHDGG
jgi:hypothetical protein